MIPGVDDRAICFVSAGGAPGVWAPLAQAQVPVLDRGFLFGDGVYEVVPVCGRRALRWPEHRARMQRSLAQVRIADPFDDAGWLDLLGTLVARNASLGADLLAYFQVTRGVARRDHAFPAAAVPTVFAMATRWNPPSQQQVVDGIDAVTMDDLRWQRCDIKSISLLGNVLARQAAVEQGASEAVLIRDGLLTEGSAANLWVVRQGKLATPAAGTHLLEGVRVGLIEDLARAVGLPFVREPIPLDALRGADEILLTSAGREILAVTRLDGRSIGNGRPGPVFRRLYEAYRRAKTLPEHLTDLPLPLSQ